MKLLDVMIKNGIALHNTSPLDCTKCLGMSLINSRFYDNMSNRGGAISAQTDSYNPIIFIVETSLFINNMAENAGAIYVSNHIMQIRN